ncbi:Mitochondrial ATP synthase epsilon chain family protein [Leishmania donovani]|uniref:Mitochondrial ATP synthase epsilon chain family protein n=1 Tax=Leishmania donovani TaxID=5661 RepID=A0A504X2N4_LEIDO|nr:Mitochondrial ATP synthase epsilon chain family protein [Leishmania donovani]
MRHDESAADGATRGPDPAAGRCALEDPDVVAAPQEVALNWRDQGISYVKYLNVTTEALHMATKDKARAKYSRFSAPNYVAMKNDSTGAMEEVKKVPAFTKDY